LTTFQGVVRQIEITRSDSELRQPKGGPLRITLKSSEVALGEKPLKSPKLAT